MQPDESSNSDSHHSPTSNENGSLGKFQPSAKLMDKMEKLARWRIEPSSIEFQVDACEFNGGNATVSQGFLNTIFPPINDAIAQTSARREVAVKKLKIEDTDIERLLGLSLREARFLVELSHPNIVKLEGFVEDLSDGVIWLVFPWEANGNLRDFVASQDWEIPERISLIFDVTRGIEYIHTQEPPICHGDLKSLNILVNSNYRAVITDFGSARRLTQEDIGNQAQKIETEEQSAPSLEATFTASANTITLTGNEFTLRWAAPELLSDNNPSIEIDIWALGWIAYEVMTNSIPFHDVLRDTSVIVRVILGDLPSITGDARMSLMLQLCSLMSECWRTDPRKRPTANDCQKSLRWMPMVVPNANRATATKASEAQSPELLLRLGQMHLAQDDFVNASKCLKKALDIFTDTGDSKGRASVLVRLAEVQRLQGRIEDAITFYSDALQICTTIGDKQGRAFSLWGLAQTYLLQDDDNQAAKFFSDALEIYADLEDGEGKAAALFGLAQIHRFRDEFSQAVPLYFDSLRIMTDIGKRQGVASSMWGLAEVHRDQKQYNEAISFYSDALQIYTDIGDSRGRAMTLLGLADLNRDQGHPNDAIDMYEQAGEIFKQIGDAGSAAGALDDAAKVHR